MSIENKTNKKSKRKSNCKCGIKTNLPFCQRCSKVRAFIGLKNGFNHLKTRDLNSGRLLNPIWYSYYSKNNKSVEQIISKMLDGIENKFGAALQVVTFYDNTGNKEEIKSYRY